MTKFLLTGATGQVGSELLRALAPLGEVIAPPRSQCDLARPQTLSALVDEVRPDVIVNAAAYTAVDKAETESALAMTVNAEAPGVLAAAARRHGALMVHYSTDYVFDGRKTTAYDEDDLPNPLGSYGRSKLAGDEAVRALAGDHLIFRTTWVYAARGGNFLRTMLRLAAERDELRVVADQFGAPTTAALLADTTATALGRDLARRTNGAFTSGVFHLTAAGKTSWHGFATAIIAGARQRGMALRCQRIAPITTAEYPLPAARPANSSLSCRRLEARYDITLPPWEAGLAQVLAEIVSA
jgi:dTDP-4-dehydrorhamnose reductase